MPKKNKPTKKSAKKIPQKQQPSKKLTKGKPTTKKNVQDGKQRKTIVPSTSKKRISKGTPPKKIPTVPIRKPVRKKQPIPKEPVKKSSPKKQEREEKPKEKLKYKGRFISKEFDRFIRAAAKSAKKNPQKILDDPQYTKLVDNLLEQNKATTYKKVKNIAKTLKKTGKSKVTIVTPKGKEVVTPGEAVKRLAKIEQKLRKKSDLVYFAPKTIQYINGTFEVYALDEDFDSEDLEDYLDSDSAEYMVYEED